MFWVGIILGSVLMILGVAVWYDVYRKEKERQELLREIRVHLLNKRRIDELDLLGVVNSNLRWKYGKDTLDELGELSTEECQKVLRQYK